MSHFPNPIIQSALAVADARNALTVAGVVLFAGRERALFIADGSPSTQRKSLAFFSNSVQRRIAGRAVLAAHRLTGDWLPRTRIAVPKTVRERIDGDFSAVALYCGSPGPLQKVTLYVPARQPDHADTVVKISIRPGADRLIEREAANLKILAHLPLIVRSRIPPMVAAGTLESGRSYLATLARKGRVAPTDLRAGHVEFLAALAMATAVPLPWTKGPAISRTRALLSKLPHQALPDDLLSALLHALQDTECCIGEKIVPHVYSHGDFTRFNIREGDSGFTVFDWEYACALANPLADLLHYFLSQPTSRSAVPLMRSAIASSIRFLSSMTWEYAPTLMEISALALHSLVDTIAFYASTTGRLNMESFIIQRYVWLVRNRTLWETDL